MKNPITYTQYQKATSNGTAREGSQISGILVILAALRNPFSINPFFFLPDTSQELRSPY